MRGLITKRLRTTKDALTLFAAVVAVVAGGVLVALVLVRLAPDWLTHKSGLDPVQLDEARGRSRTALFALLAGAIALVGAFYTGRTFALNRRGQITERFTRAIDQLGSDKTEIRLGGIYALERIARESRDERGPILEVLTAYVRENSPWPPRRESDPAARSRRGSQRDAAQETTEDARVDIKATLAVLARRDVISYEPGRPLRIDLARTNLRGVQAWSMDLRFADLSSAQLQHASLGGADMHLVDLTGADLKGANLESANLGGARLEGANLDGAHLQGADLSGAGLRGAYLGGALLQGANLRTWLGGVNLQGADLKGVDLSSRTMQQVNLEGADIREADLRGANLDSANLQGANLQRACLDGADLRGANLQGANLQRARLERADLRGANLEGADLRDANLGHAQLHSANFVGAQLLPTGSDLVHVDGTKVRREPGAAYLAGAHCDDSTTWPAGFSLYEASVTREEK